MKGLGALSLVLSWTAPPPQLPPAALPHGHCVLSCATTIGVSKSVPGEQCPKSRRSLAALWKEPESEWETPEGLGTLPGILQNLALWTALGFFTC